jgi:arylsulfatase A-like enzyme
MPRRPGKLLRGRYIAPVSAVQTTLGGGAGRRCAVGLACGALANAVQIPFFWPAGAALTPDFFVAHLLITSVSHVVLALLLGGKENDRRWALAALLVAPALGLWPSAHAFAAGAGVAALFGLAAGLCVLGASALPGRGAPLVASAAGAALAGELVAWQLEGGPALARLAAPAALALAALLAGSLLPASAAVPRPRVSLGVAVLAVALAALLGPVRAAGTPRPPRAAPLGADAARPPVVLVVLDTVRADHLALYGYPRDTMPRLERFAREHGVVVDRAVANSATSLASHASLFTGLYPPRHGAYYPVARDRRPPPYAYPLRRGVPTLARLLQHRGYWTVGVTANAGPLSPAFGLDRGFAVYRAELDAAYAWKPRSPWRAATVRAEPLAAWNRLPPFAASEFFAYGVPYRRAHAITDEAISLVDAAGDRPLFLFVNYFDAHWPYNPPLAWRDRFPGRRRGEWDRRGLDRAVVMKVMQGSRDLTREERAHMVALYDGELAALDVELGRLLDRLERHPRWPEMLVVITSDHGEAFGEHRLIRHGVSLYGELTRVPFVAKPGRGPTAPPRGARLDGPIQSVDVFPTVLEHAGVRLPEGIDGVAWGWARERALAWIGVKQEFFGPRPPRLDRDLRSVEYDGWKLIASSTGGRELYELARDPAERNDLAESRPDERTRLEGLLGRPAAPRRWGATGHSDRGTIERLRALGYVR